MQQLLKGSAYKYALAGYITLYGVLMFFTADAGVQKYILAAVRNDPNAVRWIASVLIIDGMFGLVVWPRPLHIWGMLLPYLLYVMAATYGASQIQDASPTSVFQLYAPIVITFAYVWERLNV